MCRALNKRYSCCRGKQGSVGGTGTCSPSWMAWFYTVHWQASVCKCGPWTGALRKVTFSTAPASCPLSKGLISPNVPLCECMLKSKCQGNWGGVSESYSLTEQQACPETPMFLFQNAIFSPGHVHLIVINTMTRYIVLWWWFGVVFFWLRKILPSIKQTFEHLIDRFTKSVELQFWKTCPCWEKRDLRGSITVQAKQKFPGQF